jgi:uncharacterized protein (DUF58 family)
LELGTSSHANNRRKRFLSARRLAHQSEGADEHSQSRIARAGRRAGILERHSSQPLPRFLCRVHRIPRYLDWRVFARSDRYFIKKFEDETNLRCYVLADHSRSMAYGSAGYTKAEYAATLAATLAYFLHLQGDAVGLLTFDEQIRDYLPARHRAGHLRHLMQALEQPSGGQATNLSAPLKRIVEIVRKRGLMVLLSDFLTPVEHLEPDLIALAACGHEVVVFQVLDPAELTFAFDNPTMFEDSESGRVLFIDPVTARKEYLRKLEAHCDALRATCQRLGIACHRLATDRPLELALFDFLRERSQRGRGTKRFAGKLGVARSGK